VSLRNSSPLISQVVTADGPQQGREKGQGRAGKKALGRHWHQRNSTHHGHNGGRAPAGQHGTVASLGAGLQQEGACASRSGQGLEKHGLTRSMGSQEAVRRAAEDTRRWPARVDRSLVIGMSGGFISNTDHSERESSSPLIRGSKHALAACKQMAVASSSRCRGRSRCSTGSHMQGMEGQLWGRAGASLRQNNVRKNRCSLQKSQSELGSGIRHSEGQGAGRQARAGGRAWLVWQAARHSSQHNNKALSAVCGVLNAERRKE